MKMGIVRDLFEHTGNHVVCSIIESQRFANGIFIPEILLGCFLVQDQSVGFGQGGFGIAVKERDGKDIKK